MSPPIRRFFEFGPYRVDTVNRLVLRSGEPVGLKAKVVDTLLLLLDHAGDVVEKEELMSRLWPNTFVEEGNLTQNIYVLRKALDDPEVIETVPRRGYRFAAQVRTWVEPPAESEPPRVRPGAPDGEVRPKSRAVVIAASLVLPVVCVLGVLAAWPGRTDRPFNVIRMTRLTTTGDVTRAAISPDGSYLGFVAAESGRQSLRLRQIATGKDLELVPPRALEFYGLTFSHDGNFLYYVTQEFNHVGQLFRVSALGGQPIRLVDDVDSPPTLSPDDKRLAYIRFTPGTRSIMVAGADGTNERALASTAQGDNVQIAPVPLMGPAWSPDAKRLACAVSVTVSGSEYQTIYGFDAMDGGASALTTARWQAIGELEWLPDGRGLVATAAETGAATPHQVWFVEPGGEARRITNDLGDYRDVSASSAAAAFVTVQTERRGNIWIAPTGKEDQSRQTTFTNYDGLAGIAWMPDKRIVYTLSAGAEQDLWASSITAGSPEQLTRHAGLNRQPVVSPDGGSIVFVSNRSGRERLWKMDATGGHPVELTHGDADVDPTFSADGKFVIFRGMDSGRGYVFRVPIEGGVPVRVSDKPAGDPAVSPDGSLIAVYHRPAAATTAMMAVVPAAGGEPRLVRPLPGHFGRFRWTPDGRDIAWSARYEGVGNIWAQPIGGGDARPLTRWSADPVFFFDWSPDGAWLAYVKGTVRSDAVLVSATR